MAMGLIITPDYGWPRMLEQLACMKPRQHCCYPAVLVAPPPPPLQRLQGWGARERRKTKEYEKDFERQREKKEEMVRGEGPFMLRSACT